MQKSSKRSADSKDPNDSTVSKKLRSPTTIETVMEKHLTHESSERYIVFTIYCNKVMIKRVYLTRFRLNASSNGRKMCYFQFRIDDQPSERVIFEVNDEFAPIMASKFRDFCTGNIPPGYLGSTVSPVSLERIILVVQQ